MSTAATQTRDEALVAAAVDINAAAAALGEAYTTFTGLLAEYSRDAWTRAGFPGQDDIKGMTDGSRVAEETAGALLAAGLADVIHCASSTEIHPVTDFPDRWAERARRGKLVTTRTR